MPGSSARSAPARDLSTHPVSKIDTKGSDRGLLLLISGGKDHTVPETITRATLKQYRH
jgi:hypothetical protein